MRIFIQISVGGFKIFDLESFNHSDNNLKYINIDEIRKVEQTKTHLVNHDMHGLRSETCGLFSNGDIEILLHNDTFNSTSTSILFIKRFSNQKDSEIDKKVSALFVSETYEETNILRNLTVARLSEDKLTETLLYKLLTERIIDNKQVIVFDKAIWNDLKIHTENNEFSNQIKNVLDSCNQMMVLRFGIGIHSLLKRLPGLLNSHPYTVLTQEDLSKIKNGEKPNESISVIPENIDFSSFEKDFEKELKSKAQNLLKSIRNRFANKLGDYSDKLK